MLHRALFLCIAFLGVHANIAAHDLPGKVSVLIFAQPQTHPGGAELVVLARIPLEAMTEVQWPLRGPGYLDLPQAQAALEQAARMYFLERVQFFADGVPLGDGKLVKTQVALPADKSFVDLTTALSHVNGPGLPTTEDVYWKQANLDMLVTFPLPATTAKLSMDHDLSRISMETHTVLRYVPADGGEERAFTFVGYPGRVELQPSWWYATSRFVVLGFEHILSGIDHVLFLLCLAIPMRRVRTLIPIITAFTIAHSITLICSALALVPSAAWFTPLIETLIAATVFYMACENIVAPQLQLRWLVVFVFGLIHGFGFSFILAERMQFAGSHLVSALLAFNVGVELGQLLVLIVAVPALAMFFDYLKREVLGRILLSAIVAHVAWHWLTERGEQLLELSWQWPAFDAEFFVAAMRWAMLLLASAMAAWGLHELFKRFVAATPPPSHEGGAS